MHISILALPNFDKLFEVDSEASRTAVGGVLSPEAKPTAHFSENPNELERKYCL